MVVTAAQATSLLASQQDVVSGTATSFGQLRAVVASVRADTDAGLATVRPHELGVQQTLVFICPGMTFTTRELVVAFCEQKINCL